MIVCEARCCLSLVWYGMARPCVNDVSGPTTAFSGPHHPKTMVIQVGPNVMKQKEKERMRMEKSKLKVFFNLLK